MSQVKYAVIGGGINGLAVARQLKLDYPEADITVFEKEAEVAEHQSSHNSGVVHAGLYYEPGSLKARLCRRGVELVRDYCQTNDLPYEECGKLVVALNDVEEERLKSIYERSLANGVPGVEMIYGQDKIREIEPNAVGQAALNSPETAITCYGTIAKHMGKELVEKGGTIHLNSEVHSLTLDENEKIVITLEGGKVHEERFDYAVTCAGLQSDRLAKNSGDKADPKIIPFFGQYFIIDPAKKDEIKGLIYPVPDPKYPFLGVHFTKRVDGQMMIGPNAFLSKARENYDGKGISFKDVVDYATYPGFWRFAIKNIPTAMREVKTVFSQKRFVNDAARYVPSLKDVSVTPTTRGIRAQAMAKDGSLVDDFVIRREGKITHIRNAPSPGATSSMAIAEYIVREVMTGKAEG